jgi:hypothetical protein
MINFMNGFVPGAVTWVDKRRPLWRQIICATAIAVLAGFCASGCAHAPKAPRPAPLTKEQRIEAKVRALRTEQLVRAYPKYASGVDGSYAARCRYFAVLRVLEERGDQSGVSEAIEEYALSRGDEVALRDAVRLLGRLAARRGVQAESDTLLRVYHKARRDIAKAEALAVLEEARIKIPSVFYEVAHTGHDGIIKQAEDRYCAFLNRTL